MIFTPDEERLVRQAASVMSGGQTGTAQLSSLVDIAMTSDLRSLVLDIDGRCRGGRLRSVEAQKLRALVEAIRLTEEEERRLPGGRNDAYSKAFRRKVTERIREEERAGRIASADAEKLVRLAETVTLTGSEHRMLAGGVDEVLERALRQKRALALRYVGKLRSR